jgi:thiol oxidase
MYRNFAVRIRELAALQSIDLKVYAISCAPNLPLCVDQGVKGFPKIRLFKPGDTMGMELSHHSQINPYQILEKLGIDFDGDKEDWDVEKLLAEHTMSQLSMLDRFRAMFLSEKKNTQSLIRRTRDALKADIHLSFDYALRYEVFTNTKMLSQEQQESLRNWLTLLTKTLPSSWELVKLIQELIDNFIYIVKSHDYLVAVLDEYPAPTERWSDSCSHGKEDEGYTCGLWEMFHTMSIGMVEYNKAMAFDEDRLLATETVANTLRDYLFFFFGCSECVSNFIKAYDLCALDRCDRLSKIVRLDEAEWLQLPLWLFETHNAVNVRLFQQRANLENRRVTANDIQSVKWPPKSECKACWTGDGSWDAEYVYKILFLEYGPRDANSAELMRELVEKQNTENRDPILQYRHFWLIGIMALGWGLTRRFKIQRKEKMI